MEPWIVATLAAAFFQALRFALQKRLTLAGLSTLGATAARFVWAAPMLAAGLGLWIVATGTPLPRTSALFWAFALTGGAAQILATLCVVALFRFRAFAVGLTFKKTEVLQTALLGWLLLGDRIGPAGLAALAAGFVALLVLSAPPRGAAPGEAARAVTLGLASGACFAVAGVGYRAAVLALDAPMLLQAATALTCATLAQAGALALWFGVANRAEGRRLLAAWRPGLAVGATSLAGSLGWFAAFAQQNAAIVFALGQVELLFALALGVVLFGERPTVRELAGMGLLVASLIWLVAVV